jgi:hypothetical protein
VLLGLWTSLSCERIVEDCLLVHWEIATWLLYFMSILLLKPQNGSGAVEGLLSREREHFLGWDMHVGNESL